MPNNKPSKSNESLKGVNSLQEINKLFSEEDTEEIRHNSNSYNVVSIMMFLTGVDKRHFEEHTPPLTAPYETYNKNTTTRIIRNLCIIRTALIKNFLNITRALTYELHSLSTIPEYVPSESVTELSNDGITFPGGKPDVNNYIIKINQELSNRINQVQSLFPDWVKWDYIRPLFIMPNGFKKEGIKKEADFYNSNRNRYPYQVWLNWEKDDRGNIFASDYKFISTIYEANGDSFEDKSLINGTNNDTLVSLYDFIEGHKKVLLVVDCENSDPVKLAATLLSLDGSQMSSIYKIMLFDSAHTTPAWETLCNTGITKTFDTEHIVVSTLYEQKSQVDMALAVNVTKEVYVNAVDAVILASSDSDYWTLIKNMPGTDFLVLLEKMKSGNIIRDTLRKDGYQYCFIDDFCTGKAYTIKTDTILNAIQKEIDDIVNFNIKEMLEEQAKISWLSLSEKEKDTLFNRYLKTIKLKIQPDGKVRLIIKE